MFFRTPRFIRRYFRRQMHPMEEEKAIDYKKRFAILYAFIAWNAFGWVIYQMASGNKSWPITAGIRKKEEDMGSPGVQWARALGYTNAQVVRVSGTNISEPQNVKIDLDTGEFKILPTEGTEVTEQPIEE